MKRAKTITLTNWSEPGSLPQWCVLLWSEDGDFGWVGHAAKAAQAISFAKADARVAHTVLVKGARKAAAFRTKDWNEVEPENPTLSAIRISDDLQEACRRLRGSDVAPLPLEQAKALLKDLLLVAASETDVPCDGDIVIQAGVWDDELEDERERLADVQLSAQFDEALTLPTPLRAALVAITLTCGDANRQDLRAKIAQPNSITLRAALRRELKKEAPAALERIAAFMQGLGLERQAREILKRKPRA